jgi:hypothetical protein
VTSHTKATFFQLANESVLTLVDEPEYLTELVLFTNRYWIDLAPTCLSDDEQRFVCSLIAIFNHSPPLLAKAIVQALIVNRSTYPHIPFGTLNEARQFVKGILVQVTKGRTAIDEEVLALMVQHYYHDDECDDELLLMELTACSWSKMIAEIATSEVLRGHFLTFNEPTLDDLLAIFNRQHLLLYHALMVPTNDFRFQLKTYSTASELIIAYADDLLTLFIEELHSSIIHHQSSRPSNHIQVGIALLEEIPTKLCLAIKKHNEVVDKGQEKFKRALLTMSEQFDQNSHQPLLLLIKLYSELTLEMSNLFLNAAKCQPKQMMDFCGYIVNIELVNYRDVVEHLQKCLIKAQSLQQCYVAAYLLVQLAKRDQVSTREVQRILIEAMNDRRAINGTVYIIDNSESTETEPLDQALFDLLLQLSFLSSSSSMSSSSQAIEQPAIKLDTNKFDWEFNQIIGADKYASCILTDSYSE